MQYNRVNGVFIMAVFHAPPQIPRIL